MAAMKLVTEWPLQGIHQAKERCDANNVLNAAVCVVQGLRSSESVSISKLDSFKVEGLIFSRHSNQAT